MQLSYIEFHTIKWMQISKKIYNGVDLLLILGFYIVSFQFDTPRLEWVQIFEQFFKRVDLVLSFYSISSQFDTPRLEQGYRSVKVAIPILFSYYVPTSTFSSSDLSRQTCSLNEKINNSSRKTDLLNTEGVYYTQHVFHQVRRCISVYETPTYIVQ